MSYEVVLNLAHASAAFRVWSVVTYEISSICPGSIVIRTEPRPTGGSAVTSLDNISSIALQDNLTSAKNLMSIYIYRNWETVQQDILAGAALSYPVGEKVAIISGGVNGPNA